MGAFYSHLVRQANRFNVENRAMRAIERKKPVSAPRHKSSEEHINALLKETADVKASLLAKNITLDAHLKEVYVTSTGMTPEIKRDRSLLPQNKLPVEDDEMGFWEPDEIPKGYCSLRQVLTFLGKHQENPNQWTADAIAKQYNLDKKNVALILEHYKLFNVYIPPANVDKRGLLSASRILASTRNMIQTRLLNSESEKQSEHTEDTSNDKDKR